MGKSDKRQIAQKLILSNLLLIVIFICYGLFSTYNLRSLSDLTQTIYDHPLVVSNAALKANNSITKMHRNMKDVVLFKSSSRIQTFINEVDQQEQIVFRQFDIIRADILGAEGQSLEREARALFANWSPIRLQVIELVRNNQRDVAAEITIGKGANHVAKLEEKMIALTNYARKKATSFMQKSEKTSTRLHTISIIFIIMAVCISFLITFFSLRQVVSDEKELIESKQLLMNAIGHAPIGMVLVETIGKFHKVNEAFCQITGYSEKELLNMSARQITHHDDYNIEANAIKQLIEGNIDKAILETRYIKKDGKVIIVYLTTSIIRDSKGKIEYFFTQIQDITERKQAESTLQASKEKYISLVDNMKSGVAVFEAVNEGEDFVFVNLNKAGEKIDNLKEDHIAGRSVLEIYPKIKEFGLFEILKKVWKSGEPEILPTSFYEDEQKSGWRDYFVYKLPSEEIVAVYSDETERKRSEKELQKTLEREQLWADIVRKTHVGVAVGYPDGRLGISNYAFQKMTGYSADELQRIHWNTVLTPPEWIDHEMTKLNELHQTKKPVVYEKEYIRKNGDRIPIELVVHPGFGKDGNIEFYHAFVSDITERKKASKALEESHKAFLAVLDGLEASVYVADMDTYEVLFMNDYMKRNYPDHSVGKKCWEVLYQKDSPCSFCKNYKLFDKDGNATAAIVWESQNPITGKWYINHDRAIKWTDGRMVKLQVATDVTSLKKMEEQLLQTRKMESIGTLAGGIAHDFNNILSSILGFTELAISEVEKGSQIEDDLQEVYKGGVRAKELIQQILTFARQSDESIQPIQVGVVAKEVVKFIKSSIPATIQIIENINSNSFIMGSPTQVHQIFMNLLTNASHAMEEEGGTLEIILNDVEIEKNSQLPSLEQGKYVNITVKDTGKGVSPEEISHIFEPYFTTKRVGKGTGMGLAVVHGIVESYGGKITVESSLGKGTTFYIYLPISKKQTADLSLEEKPLSLGKEHILFVDDEPSVSKMGNRILEQLGYTVTTKTNSLEALELFRSAPQQFDLVITDMTMPDMTGDKLAVELMKANPGIPVILCTGYSNTISEETSQELGIKAFVYKPVIKKDFATTIRNVLDEAKSIL